MTRSRISRPSVVVFKEKHGSRYFSVKNDDDLHRVALTVVKQRVKEKWYYFMTEKDLPKPPTLTKEVIVTLPAGPVKQAAVQEFNVYNRYLYDLKRDQEDKALLETAIKKKDPAAAYQFLDNRRDHEYEGYQIEPDESFKVT